MFWHLAYQMTLECSIDRLGWKFPQMQFGEQQEMFVVIPLIQLLDYLGQKWQPLIFQSSRDQPAVHNTLKPCNVQVTFQGANHRVQRSNHSRTLFSLNLGHHFPVLQQVCSRTIFETGQFSLSFRTLPKWHSTPLSSVLQTSYSHLLFEISPSVELLVVLIGVW